MQQSFCYTCLTSSQSPAPVPTGAWMCPVGANQPCFFHTISVLASELPRTNVVLSFIRSSDAFPHFHGLIAMLINWLFRKHETVQPTCCHNCPRTKDSHFRCSFILKYRYKIEHKYITIQCNFLQWSWKPTKHQFKHSPSTLNVYLLMV